MAAQAHSNRLRGLTPSERRWLALFGAMVRSWANLVPIIALTLGFGVLAHGFLAPSNLAARCACL